MTVSFIRASGEKGASFSMANYVFNFNECQDLTLVEIGSQKCDPLYSFGPFIRNEYIFHYIISGKGYVTNYRTANPLEIKAGEGFLIEPNCKHIYNADEKNPWHYIWIVFKGLTVHQYITSCGLSKDQPVYYPKSYDTQTAQKIKEHLFAILDSPHQTKPYILGHLHLFFDALILNASIQNMHTVNSPLSNIYLTEAVRYIRFHYKDISSVEEISEFCNVSRSHLTRLFKEYLHVSLQDYLIQYRLGKAQELLMNSDDSISEIAYQVGYQNETNFLRAFKKKCNVTPSQWRKERWNFPSNK